MDFGIARALDCQEHLTRHGQVAGTAKSMSPEQIRGAQADVRSDIYSLGIVLYTLLAGRAPFDGETDLALMKAQVEQAPPPLHGLVGNLPPKVEAAVMRALEKDPSARFQTVGAFSRALDACMAGPTTTPRPIPNHPDPATLARTVLNPMLHDAQASSRTVVNPALQGARRAARRQYEPSRAGSRDAASPGCRLARVARPGSALGRRRAGTPRAARGRCCSGVAAPRAARSTGDCVAAARCGVTADQRAGGSCASGARGGSDSGAARTGASSGRRSRSRGRRRSSSPSSCAPCRSSACLPTTRPRRPSAGSDAAHRFKPDERVRLMVTTSHDAHVYCYLQDETRRIKRFYPNRFNKNAAVKADAPLEIPGKMRFEIVANTPQRGGDHCLLCQRAGCHAQTSDGGRRHRFREPSGHLARAGEKRFCRRCRRCVDAGELPSGLQIVSCPFSGLFPGSSRRVCATPQVTGRCPFASSDLSRLNPGG